MGMQKMKKLRIVFSSVTFDLILYDAEVLPNGDVKGRNVANDKNTHVNGKFIAYIEDLKK